MKIVEKVVYDSKLFLLVRSLVILSIMLYLEILLLITFHQVFQEVFGIVIALLGLTTRVIHLNWIYLGASLLIRFMAVLLYQ